MSPVYTNLEMTFNYWWALLCDILPFTDLLLKTPGDKSMNMHCWAYHCIWTVNQVYIDLPDFLRLYLGEFLVFLLED